MLSGHNDAWLTPAEVRDSDGFSNFHIIALNCDRGTQLRDAKVNEFPRGRASGVSRGMSP